jgi:hypothetical protein
MIDTCVYLFLIWYYFANFILSHINLANDLLLFSAESEDIPKLKMKTYTLLYIIVPSYFACFVIVSCLSFNDLISKETLYVINAIFSLITPILFFAYYIFLLLKFSGRPYINEVLKKQNKKILIIVTIWSIAHLLRGIFGIVTGGSYFDKILKDLKNYSNEISYLIFTIAYFAVSGFIPDLFALDYTFMMTYIQKESLVEDEYISYKNSTKMMSSYKTPMQIDGSNTINNSKSHYLSLNSNSNANIDDINITNKIEPSIPQVERKIVKEFMINFNEIQLTEIIYQRKNGLGSVHKAVLLGIEVACRVVKFDRLSRYDLEGLFKDIEEFM